MSPNSLVRVITIVAVSGLLQPGFGQGRGGGTPAPPGGGGANGTSTPSTPTKNPTIPNTNPTPTNQQPQMAQPIYISGRVMIDDGSTPTESIVIERVCGTNPHAEGYTDTKGYFSLELGQRNTMVQDASESNFDTMGGFGNPSMGAGAQGMGTPGTSSMTAMGSDMRLMNCEIRARLAGYRSQAVSLANRRPLDNPDIGIILLHRIAPTEGNTVSMSSLAAPKDARKAFEKGEEALKKKKFEDAVKNYEKALEIYQDYASAWFQLGRIQAYSGDREAAHRSYLAAVKADPKFVPPYVELSMLGVQAQNWKEVADYTDRAAKLDSFDYPEVFFYNAVANYNLGNLDQAEKTARQAAKLDTRHRYPRVSHLLGTILAQHRDYAGAAEELRTYLKLAPTASDAPAVRTQLDQLEKLVAQSSIPAAPKQDQ